MKLSIIIVNYNVKYFVEQCLNSIYQNLSDGGILNKQNTEVFVVDNDSKDHSIKYLQKRFHQTDFLKLHLIKNARNIGFGKANNIAARKAKGDYILFLNPDTLITEHTLIDVVKFADEHPDFGAIGVKMLNANGVFAKESRRGKPTPWVSFCKMIGLTSLFPKSRMFGKYYMGFLDYNEVNEIEIVSGAFMMVRNTHKKNYFDESYFMYGEDIDLSYRLLCSGKQNYYIPTPIMHYKGESTQKSSFRYIHVFYQAMLIFFRKHYKHYSFLLSIPIQIAIIIKAAIAFIKQQFSHLSRFLHPVPQWSYINMTYFGHNGTNIKKLADTWGLNIKVIDTDERVQPEGHIAKKNKLTKDHIVIYDLADFSVSTILSNLEAEPSAVLGTYNHHTGLLITPGFVYTPDNLNK